MRDGLRTARRATSAPGFLLRAVDCTPLTVLTGVLAQSAVRRTPVLLDGSAVTIAAAVLAGRLAPGASAWFLPGQVPPSPAAQKGLEELGRPGLLDLGLGGPYGAELARAVLESAVRQVADAVSPGADVVGG